MSEETKLTNNPSEEVAKDQVVEVQNTEEKPEVVEEVVEEKEVSNTPEVKYETELVESGPLSEEIRVFKLEDLQEENDKSYLEQVKIYESSLKDISEDERTIGKVVAVSDDEILLDIGFKSEGVVYRNEFAEGELPKVGDEIEVYVDVLEDENGEMILSKRKADFMRVWERIKEMFSGEETIEGKIKSRIKGGMVVDIMGIDAFLPGSQIDVRPVTDFDAYVGKTFEFRIVKLSEMRKNIVLSRKSLLEEDLQEKRDEVLSKIKVGDELTGKVKNITDFGVFVDLGGLDGLLHITDLSWGRINHPREVVSLDQEITVKVIDHNEEKQRVSLGLKQLTPHPWEGIEQKYPVDSIITGKVVNIANYGVFVELEKGVEGLIHISEISWTKHIKHPSEVFALGQEAEAKVLSIDTEERKISLGFKQLEPDPWETIEDIYKDGEDYKGTVRNIRPHGVFVALSEGIDGFVKIEDLSLVRNIRHPKEVVKKGQELNVRVLSINKGERKILLGVKHIETDPWPEIESIYIEGAIVEGEVKKIASKVVVVGLQYGLEGIIPLSEIPKNDRKNVEESVKIGQKMQLKVLEVSKEEKRFVLSRQQAIPKKDKPSGPTNQYMQHQQSSGDKIDIPLQVIEKIAASEKLKEIEEKAIIAKEEQVVETKVEETAVKKTVVEETIVEEKIVEEIVEEVVEENKETTDDTKE